MIGVDDRFFFLKKASTVFMLVKHKIKLAQENLRSERLSIMHLILASDNLCQKIVQDLKIVPIVSLHFSRTNIVPCS